MHATLYDGNGGGYCGGRQIEYCKCQVCQYFCMKIIMYENYQFIMLKVQIYICFTPVINQHGSALKIPTTYKW